MHRSGTSLTASWLEQCGLLLQNKIGAGTGNEKGHFEDKDFLRLHAERIKQKHKKSKGWILSDSRRLRFNELQKEKAGLILKKREQVAEVWGWKDPRTTIFLEDWKTIDPTIKYLILWRPCHIVVNSLVRRSLKATDEIYKINFKESVQNWAIYNKTIIRFVEKYPKDTLLINIEDLVINDEQFFSLLEDKFDLGLTYHTLDDVFDKNSFTSKKVDFSFLEKLLFVRYQAKKIENKLISLSINISK